MMDRRNYIELVALMTLLVLNALHLPIWGIAAAICAEPTTKVLFGMILSVMLVDVLTMIYWRRD